MSSNLKVKVFQADLEWQLHKKNMDKLLSMKSELSDVDLLICPEMYTTGFSMAVQSIAEKWPTESLQSIRKLATETDTAIVASLVIEDCGKYYNRLVFVKPDGSFEQYDKRHLFTMGGEPEHYTPGRKRLIVNYKSWRIIPLICYDLRFPVWSRNCDEYDMAIYVANWPDKRRNSWLSLLKARAIENQAYVVGVNRVGTDGMGLSYSGDSIVFNAKGESVLECPQYKETTAECVLNLEELHTLREKFPVFGDSDDFSILNIS